MGTVAWGVSFGDWGSSWGSSSGEPATPAQQPAGRPRRWVRIGNKVFKATDQEVQALLEAEQVAEVPEPAQKAEPKPSLPMIGKPVVETKVEAKAEAKPLEIGWDDEDDIEFLLLH